MILLIGAILIWDRFACGRGDAKAAGPDAGGGGLVATIEKKAGEAADALASREKLAAARERAGEVAVAVRDEAWTLSEKAREATRAWLERKAARAEPDRAAAAPSPPARAPKPQAKRRGPGLHTVRPGETLCSIARDRLGHERHWGALAKANDDALHGEPDRLRAGMVLRVPAIGKDAPAKSGPAPVPPAPRETAPPRTYRVQPGDTLWRIAARELGDGAQWERILRANRDALSSPGDLRVGQVIRLEGR
jgi:nucleoid-associated protein YgaU